MRNIHYHLRNLNVNGKQRLITVYSAADSDEQKFLYGKYKERLLSSTHSSVFSYIPGLSNFDAVASVFNQEPAYAYFIKVDIDSYFPSINRQILIDRLIQFMDPYEAFELCRYAFCCPSGIAEGSALSPALSNVYLFDFDEKMTALSDCFYIRYCDDMLFLTNMDPFALIYRIQRELNTVGLSVKLDKTEIGALEDGVTFVGYFIDSNGVSIKEDRVADIMDRIRNEPDETKRAQIINGFKAYAQSPERLPGGGDADEFLSYAGDWGE